jgi:hypothetical protein
MDEIPGQSVARELRTVPDALAMPLPVECLACYVWRMLNDYGCNATLRWARRWRDARAPRATALEHRLARRGGCCDCELFLNVWSPPMVVDDEDSESGWRLRLPPQLCRGVRRGSSQPCATWVVPT